MRSLPSLSASAWTEGVNCVLQTVEDSLSSERAQRRGCEAPSPWGGFEASRKLSRTVSAENGRSPERVLARRSRARVRKAHLE